MKREENSIEAECIEKLCNLFIFTSPSVLKIQFLALYGQREEVLLFILHTLTFLCFEHFPNYMQNHFWNQILMLWWPITEKRILRRNMVRNLGTKALIRKTDRYWICVFILFYLLLLQILGHIRRIKTIKNKLKEQNELEV